MKIYPLFLIILCMASSITIYGRTVPECLTEESCNFDPSCKCYCARVCDFRDKEPEDDPIYVKNDPAGKYCYCKPWDYEQYNERCVSEESDSDCCSE